jgi:hypothetical protein
METEAGQFAHALGYTAQFATRAHICFLQTPEMSMKFSASDWHITCNFRPVHRLRDEESRMKNLNRNLFGCLCLSLALQGCSSSPDPAKVAGDIAKAQADGQKLIADARANYEKVVAANNKNVVDAQVDTKNAPAQSMEPASSATPGGTSMAPASSDVANARNEASNKIAEAQFAFDKATAEAQRNVALAQCESQTGNAQKACNETAKAKYDADVASAKSRHDAAQHSAAN